MPPKVRICREDIRSAKKVMAHAVTSLVHGKESADIAQKTAEEIFSGKGASENMNSVEVSKADLEKGIGVLELMTRIGVTASNGEARRLIQQGGLTIDDNKITDVNMVVKTSEPFIVRKGKKLHLKVELK